MVEDGSPDVRQEDGVPKRFERSPDIAPGADEDILDERPIVLESLRFDDSPQIESQVSHEDHQGDYEHQELDQSPVGSNVSGEVSFKFIDD